MPQNPLLLLETTRLIVKETSMESYSDACLMSADPEVMRYVGNGVRTPERVRETYEKQTLHQKKHGFSIGSVYDKASGEFVGRAGLIYLEMDDTHPDIEVGYTLRKEHWGKGFATELAKAWIEWGFKNLTVDQLVGVTHPDNIASQHVLENAGMKYVGMLHCYDTEAKKYLIDRVDWMRK